MNTQNMSIDLLRKIPKVDLHCHLDGSMRVATILDLAKEQQVRLPSEDPAALFRLVYAGPTCESLVEYLRGFDITLSVLQTVESLHRVAYELVQDCAKENVRYLEVRYAPLLHQQKGLSLEAVVEAVWSGLLQAQQDFGVESRMILCALRTMSSDASLETAKLCTAYKHRGVVAFDLAGAELGHPPTDHLAAFDWIHQHHMGCTIHAGEADGPMSIAKALYPAGAHRIGHGTRLQEDADLLAYVRDRQIPLEMCPSSNAQTKAVPSLGAHPAALYHKQGIMVTINTDNRLITNTTVTDELWACHQTLGFSVQALGQVIRNGFAAAFLPYPLKETLLAEFDAEWSRLTG